MVIFCGGDSSMATSDGVFESKREDWIRNRVNDKMLLF